MNFFSELKRRNVVRVGIAYLVSAWVLIEIADIMFPELGFSRRALQWLILGLALGLLPMLLLAWRYELTAQGMVRDRGPGREDSENTNTARRLDQVTVAMILVALGLVAFQRFVAPKRLGNDTVAVATVAAPVPPPAPPAPPAVPPDPRSIAVLPFANLSPDPENEYFADGMAEEVLAVLSRVEGLKVASRTSAFAFKGRDASLAEIARELNVAHLLEGSVRRQDQRVRITVQLVDATKGFPLWSQNFDRELVDIFAVQEEIAQAISGALGGALGIESAAQPVRVAQPTADLGAYEAYLRGRQLFYQRGEALRASIQLLEDAVARDPAFAQAWAVLAAASAVAPDYLSVPRKPMYERAAAAAERARGLDDTLALPYAVLGYLAVPGGDLLAGERLLSESLRRDPNDSTAWIWRGLTYLRAGDLARAEQDIRRAVEIDPLIGITHGWLGTVLGLRGERERGDAELERAAALGWNYANWLAWRFSMADGDREEAARRFRAFIDQVPNLAPSARAVVEAGHAAILDSAKSAALARAVRADHTGLQSTGWGSTLAALGMHDEAIDVELDPDLPFGDWFGREIWFPTARGMLGKPRYLEIAERAGLLAYWNEKGFPEGCRIVDMPERHLDCAGAGR
ncbi:MAG: tetratricopeptide repeat protein [Xanthomonadales bacterium]|nr:tetratricopeptide repeat protein [Xanthomonadales bacterium]